MRILILFCCFLIYMVGSAKDLKVATVDMQTLFKEYPGTLPAQKKYDAMAQEKNNDLAESIEDLNDLQKELGNPKRVLSKKERRRKEKEFKEETQDYQREKNRIQSELEERNLEMTRQLTGKIKDIVARIAKKEGIDLVLDSNDAVSSENVRDLTAEVLRAFAELKTDQTELDSDSP